jgi:4-hydroxy-3-methylbut-2-enyl diphosphate reductase
VTSPPLPVIFRKGLDLKEAVAAELNQNYHSDLVEQIKADNFQYREGRLSVYLAREFGFCYGVDRAVDYAYQTRERFPDRRVFLTGEIIHNTSTIGCAARASSFSATRLTAARRSAPTTSSSCRPSA